MTTTCSRAATASELCEPLGIDHLAEVRLDLRECDLTDANLAGAILHRARLNRADLSGALLWEANLTRAYTPGAVLTGANLTNADLWGSILHNGIITEKTARNLTASLPPDDGAEL